MDGESIEESVDTLELNQQIRYIDRLINITIVKFINEKLHFLASTAFCESLVPVLADRLTDVLLFLK